jgi:hypothetical protein
VLPSAGRTVLSLSRLTLTSWWIDREINTATEKESQLWKDRGRQVLAIIPLNLDDHLFKWEGSHAAMLRKRLAPNFVGWESDNAVFDREIENVIKALRTDEGAREKPPEPRL